MRGWWQSQAAGLTMMWAMGPSVTSSPGVNAVSVKVPSLSPGS